MSDTHYISRSMLEDPDDREIKIDIAVVEQALAQAAAESDTIIISGDLTDWGDRLSHEDFAALLHSYKEKGKRIFVIFATHDFHHHRAYVRKAGGKVRYKSAPWEKPYFDIEKADFRALAEDEFKNLSDEELRPQLVKACTPEELWDIYREFGRDQAISCDDESFSYCIDLDESTRCLMLNDIFRNEEALHDISPTFTPTCFCWIKEMIDLAKQEGKFIFVCSHHPFAPCVPLHRIGTGSRNLRSPEPAHTLADLGIELAFTGHVHASAVNFCTSAAGNRLCHINTPSVRFYPPSYRKVELDGVSGKIAYECVDINIPEAAGIEESSLREYYLKIFKRNYFKEYTSIKPPLNKIVAEGKIGDFGFLFKKKAGLSGSEYASIKDRGLFDLFSDVIFNMLTGDGKYTPDTPEYKFLMTAAAFCDSIVDAQPFADIRSKVFKGYSAKETVEAMLFKNGVSDNKDEFDFRAVPGKKTETPEFTSRAGDILMAIICILAVPLSALIPPAVILGLPIKTLKKKLDLKRSPYSPLMKY